MTRGPVVIDLSPAQSRDYPERGIARHTLDFTRAVVAHHPELVGHLLVDPRRAPLASIEEWVDDERTIPLDAWLPRPGDILHLISPFELDQPLRRLWPRAARPARARLVVTVHDLVPEIFPAEYLADPGLRRRWRARRGLVRAADRVLTLSRSATSDVTQRLGIPPSKITLIGAGCAAEFRPPAGPRAAAGAALRHSLVDLATHFVVYNGGADPRKNLDGLLGAWALLPAGLRHRWQLVIAGRMPPLAQHHYRVRADQLGLGSGVLLTGFVTDATLVGLYQAADLMIFPSLYEGYGLPVVEAMACGAPVLAAATSSLVELVDPEATFDPRDPAAMADAIARGLTDGAFRSRLLAASARPGPTWRDAAARAASVYRELATKAAAPSSRRPGRFAPAPSSPRPGRFAPAPSSRRPGRFAPHSSAQRSTADPGPLVRAVLALGPLGAEAKIAFLLPSTDSPWAAADRALAEALGTAATVDCFGRRPEAAPMATFGATSAIRGGYDLVVLTLAGHQAHRAALEWGDRRQRDPGCTVIAVARERSLAGLYRSLGPEPFAAAWRAHYPSAPLSPAPSDQTALMVRAAVDLSDRYLVSDGDSADRIALELPPALVGRVVVVDPSLRAGPAAPAA